LYFSSVVFQEDEVRESEREKERERQREREKKTNNTLAETSLLSKKRKKAAVWKREKEESFAKNETINEPSFSRYRIGGKMRNCVLFF
jgi:RecA-family ATPase